VAYRLEIAAKSLPGVRGVCTREVPGLTNGCSRRNCSSPETAPRGSSRVSSRRLHPPGMPRHRLIQRVILIAAFVLAPVNAAVSKSQPKSQRRS